MAAPEIGEGGICTAQLNIIGPGREARHQRILPGGLAPGDYRFSTRVEAPLNGGPQRTLLTEPFQVAR